MSGPPPERVSFDDEPLILVDAEDRVVGYGPKADVHAGDGILHRAFSVFLFDSAGRVLLQQRSAEKPLWPLFWSNACCSHPRRGETLDSAAVRRLAEELGVAADPKHIYSFQYHARYEDAGSEHELCGVYLARSDAPIIVNESEVAAIRWITASGLDAELSERREGYTPWFQMEWARLRGEFAAELAPYIGARA